MVFVAKISRTFIDVMMNLESPKNEDEILDRIKHDNLIGKGGSGSVYRVQFFDGTDFAVKHIWNSDSGNRKISGTTSPMLGKPGKKSKEFEAEVETLSSIRHVNRVKLYCSITSDDSSLQVSF
ncbi:Receptor-like protein kinase HAIKU2 [Capsicum chinense]|nr:Receptor-like protein kinase HAIKU2 [Capsicum chinense]